jgi:hypothetical protein
MSSLNLARISALVAVGSVAFALAPAGCIGGYDYSNVPEGDRCNPYDSHNECGSGLNCTVSSWQVANQGGTSYQGTPEVALGSGAGTNSAGAYNVLAFCPENYCCPVDGNGNLYPPGPNNTNPNCQPGCNGGAASICASIGDTTAPYVGVCGFADDGVYPSEAGSTPEDAGSTPEDTGSTPADGSGGG